MDQRKAWTARQDELRRLIKNRARHDAALALFMRQHAEGHSAVVSAEPVWSLQDDALTGLDVAAIRFCPPKVVNSIAWNLWHAARIEDMTITWLVLGQPQVIDRGGWGGRLGLDWRDCGSGMQADQVREFSTQVDIPALVAYRAAVGCSTRAGVPSLGEDDLRQGVPESAVRALQADGSISPQAPWLAEFYLNRNKGFFLMRTATSHNFQHVSAAWRLANAQRR